MPLFPKEVDDFIDLVLERWDDLYPIKSYQKLCDELYTLYHAETAQVDSNKTQDVFQKCIEALMKYHQDLSGTVKPDRHGYHEFHSNMSLLEDSLEEPWRVYVNASTRNVIVLGRILVHLVCLTGKAVYFKIATTAQAVDSRKDAIVIYVFGRERAQEIATELGNITGGTLTPTVPSLSKEIAHGISIAADPSTFNDSVSFGQSRVRPFATAIRCFRKQFAEPGLLDDLSEKDYYEVFSRLLVGAFKAHGINPMDPASISKVLLSKMENVKASAVQVPDLDIKAAKLYLRFRKKAAMGV